MYFLSLVLMARAILGEADGMREASKSTMALWKLWERVGRADRQ